MTFDVRRYGALGVPGVDYQGEIQAALTAAGKVQGTVLLPATFAYPDQRADTQIPVSYGFSSVLALPVGVTLQGEGPGSVLQALTADQDGLSMLSGSSACDFTLKGTNLDHAAAEGIVLGGSTRCRMARLTIEHWGAFGINFGGGSSGHTLTDLIVRNGKRAGILMGNCTDCVLTRVEAYGNVYNGIDCSGTRNILNTCQSHENGLANTSGWDDFGLIFYGYNGVDTRFNQVLGGHYWGNKNHNILVISQAGGAVTHTLFQGMMCLSSVSGDGLHFLGNGGNVSDNRIAGGVSNLNARHGVMSLDCTLNTITIDARQNAADGVNVTDTGTRVHDCVLHDNTGTGLKIEAGSSAVTVRQNDLAGNTVAQYTDSGTGTVKTDNVGA